MTLSSFLKSNKAQNPHYVLFGNPVEHSLSPQMHNTALEFYNIDARYYAIQLQSNELSQLASYLNYDAFLGANITIPYKQLIADYLDTVDPTAQAIGAVNTIVKEGYRVKGFNTDVGGFLDPLQSYIGSLEGGRAIIFGTGGASRALVAALSEIGMQEVYLVSRNPSRSDAFSAHDHVSVISYDAWPSYASETSLFVNATPLGMDPKVDTSPVDEQEAHYVSDSVCYDIVYNPLQTKFLQLAEEAGATTIGGLEMLIQQGSRSFEHWTGRSFPIEKIRNLLHEQFQH
ncbi:shikimate dehydrogenase [Fodinibius salsisoli]|uniref:Shikimate dehydrogenase (NADP(+)) n=1 Tax=Fodinibius salsisoli TaxID=2820877 RepID=A0ABT3PMQ2_9BACT|nr:shikimate dehydrogenase [Fodinibius salsisoli]MCW9707225.1 shikimate dehydrogenase [Fodinibius salsisoli]